MSAPEEGFRIFQHAPIVQVLFRHLTPIGQWNLVRCNRFLWNNFAPHFKQNLNRGVLESLQCQMGQELGLYLYERVAGPDAEFMLTGQVLMQILQGEDPAHWRTDSVKLIVPRHVPIECIGEVYFHNRDDGEIEMNKILDGFAAIVAEKGHITIDFVKARPDGTSVIGFKCWGTVKGFDVIVPAPLGPQDYANRRAICKPVYWHGRLCMLDTEVMTRHRGTIDAAAYFKRRFSAGMAGHLFPASRLATHVRNIYYRLQVKVRKYKMRGFEISVTNATASIADHVATLGRREADEDGVSHKRIKLDTGGGAVANLVWAEIWRASFENK